VGSRRYEAGRQGPRENGNRHFHQEYQGQYPRFACPRIQGDRILVVAHPRGVDDGRFYVEAYTDGRYQLVHDTLALGDVDLTAQITAWLAWTSTSSAALRVPGLGGIVWTAPAMWSVSGPIEVTGNRVAFVTGTNWGQTRMPPTYLLAVGTVS
jgi:hypothetical protein